MNISNDESLRHSVQVIGEPWENSAYYELAEQLVHMLLFWDNNTPFKRLFDRLDLTVTLDLGCGYGRHAERVVTRADKLILMDIFEKNLTACEERLRGHDNVSYIQGNGYTFAPIEDASITAIYCYDAMVHFSPDIVESYVLDAARILKPKGMILLHHSNYDTQGNDQHYGLNPHARNHMTYELFSAFAANAGLEIVESAAIDWGDAVSVDRVSLLRKP
jgi:SAM-dependent methyltransferase